MQATWSAPMPNGTLPRRNELAPTSARRNALVPYQRAVDDAHQQSYQLESRGRRRVPRDDGRGGHDACPTLRPVNANTSTVNGELPPRAYSTLHQGLSSGRRGAKGAGLRGSQLVLGSRFMDRRFSPRSHSSLSAMLLYPAATRPRPKKKENPGSPNPG